MRRRGAQVGGSGASDSRPRLFRRGQASLFPQAPPTARQRRCPLPVSALCKWLLLASRLSGGIIPVNVTRPGPFRHARAPRQR